MLSNIPEELRALQQWVCFNIADDGRKIPYTPGSDNMAASNNPRDWRSFRAALKDVESGKRQHVGFCFSSTDPYTFIDLDDPEDSEQDQVFKRIKTYAQRSISGEGCHLIARGTFEGSGKHPSSPHAGIFKENRFCLMTGDIIQDRSEIIEVSNDDLQAIHSWLGGGSGSEELGELVEYQSEIPDQTVVDMGCDRFTKFRDLCRGKWQKYEEYHNDHSTADHAFIAMLCDLTPSNDQVRFLFYASGMWNAERADKKAAHGPNGYVDRTIRKVRSQQARNAAIASRVTLCFGEEEPEPVEVIEDAPKGPSIFERMPEGLIKDIYRYSMKTSFYSLPEASFCSALTTVSGIAGRAYLTSTSSGLNMWSILVGGTSCGKDEYQACIGRIITALEKKGMKSVGKLFGGELASGQAIEQVFADRKRYIAYIPEFGDVFKNIANPLAPDYIRNLNRALLNSYNAAGKHGSIRARRKAQGVEGEESIERPCLVLAGEATPESLYGSMTTRELATGFLQRFLLVNVPPESWSMAENPEHSKAPPSALLARIEELVLLCDGMEVDQRKGKNYITVEEEPEATKILHDYRIAKRREIMLCPDGIARKEVINRAGLKVLRIASLFAVSRDFHTPLVTVEDARWAIEFVEMMDSYMLSKFNSGEIGSGQTKQEAEVVKAIKVLASMKPAERRALGMNKKVSASAFLIPLSALKDLVVNNASFSTDKRGAVTAFEQCVESLCKSGSISKLDPSFCADNYDHRKGVLLCVQ